MKYGYVRASTDEQETKRQEIIMESLGVDKIIIEHESGKNISDRPKFQAMMALLDKGDVVCVESISRLSRSVLDFLNISKELEERGIVLISKKENFDTSNAYGKFAMNVFASLYQMEREMMLDRQKEGISAAKLLGVQFGRKPKDVDDLEFKKMVESQASGKISGAEAADKLGISLSTYNRRKKELIKSARLILDSNEKYS